MVLWRDLAGGSLNNARSAERCHLWTDTREKGNREGRFSGAGAV